MKRYWTGMVVIVGMLGSFLLGWGVGGQPTQRAGQAVAADDPPKMPAVKGWTKGKGWGPWGKEDEVGALNTMTTASVKAALALAKQGKVHDLGVNYDAESFKWPGHSPGVIMTFRSPEGVKRQGDFKAAVDPKLNPAGIGWHSCALFINDNVATQIDSLGHITVGPEYRWYNGFKEADWGGNFGIRKCDATTIPPIITRGVLIDVAGARGVEALPSHYPIGVSDLKMALEKQQTKLRPGDTVLIRTGTLRYWGENGSNHEKLKQHDSAGITLEAAKWLVEEQGAILIGSDTSGLEHAPGPNEPQTFIPVHRYLLVEQGVHIGEFHYLEDLARERAHEFCYVCTTNKIRGTTAGFALRPLALR